MKNAISMAVLCLIANINPFVKADQPVHCLREQLYGVWNFHVSKEKALVNLYETDEVCSHNVPNKVQLVNSDHKFAFDTEDIYRVSLMDNYKAEAVLCPGGGQCGETPILGKWTSIYD